MKRVLGYTLFWIAIGMIIALVIPHEFISILVIAALLLVSYYLFSSC